MCGYFKHASIIESNNEAYSNQHEHMYII